MDVGPCLYGFMLDHARQEAVLVHIFYRPYSMPFNCHLHPCHFDGHDCVSAYGLVMGETHGKLQQK